MAIYQEKNKKKWTKDGRSWYFRVYYTDIYGNRKQKVSKLYMRKPLAREAERNFLNNIENNEVKNHDMKFAVIYIEWLEYKKQLLKVTSYYRIKKTLDKHVLGYFENYKLDSINLKTLLNWKNELNKKNISLDYQNKIIGYMKEILNYAKDMYHYDSAIINKLQKNRIEVRERVKNSQWNFWTYEEFENFIGHVDNPYYYTIFYFLYFTGLRIGELIALTWKDLDFEKKTLSINKSFSDKIEGQKYIITDPKTTNSIRIIDLSEDVLNLMKKHYNTEKKIYNFSENMFIFGNVEHLSATTLNRYLKFYINNAECKPITLHGFRHSHVSLLINLGCDKFDVAERVGDTVSMIESTYIHMFPEKKSNIVEKINNFER